RLYITSKNVRIGKLDLSNVDYISEEDHNNIYKRCDVKRNDILLTKDGANTGNACINNLDDEFSLLSSVAFLRPDKSVTDFKFLYQLLVSPKSQYLIKESMAGQAITRITLNKLKSFQFYFPPLPEQRKIAAILSTWDEAIEKTQSLIHQIRQRNKGLAQQLLTGKKRLKKLGTPWPLLKFSDFLVESRIRGTNGLHSKKITVKLYGKGVFPKEENRIGSKNTQYYVRHAGQFIYSKLDFLNGAFGLIPKEMDGFESTLDLPCFDIRTDRVNPSFLLRFA